MTNFDKQLAEALYNYERILPIAGIRVHGMDAQGYTRKHDLKYCESIVVEVQRGQYTDKLSFAWPEAKQHVNACLGMLLTLHEYGRESLKKDFRALVGVKEELFR